MGKIACNFKQKWLIFAIKMVIFKVFLTVLGFGHFEQKADFLWKLDGFWYSKWSFHKKAIFLWYFCTLKKRKKVLFFAIFLMWNFTIFEILGKNTIFYKFFTKSKIFKKFERNPYAKICIFSEKFLKTKKWSRFYKKTDFFGLFFFWKKVKKDR